MHLCCPTLFRHLWWMPILHALQRSPSLVLGPVNHTSHSWTRHTVRGREACRGNAAEEKTECSVTLDSIRNLAFKVSEINTNVLRGHLLVASMELFFYYLFIWSSTSAPICAEIYNWLSFRPWTESAAVASVIKKFGAISLTAVHFCYKKKGKKRTNLISIQIRTKHHGPRFSNWIWNVS